MAMGDDVDLAPGEGTVVETDGKQVAMYKKEDGSLVKLSAVCTHAGCIVDWNKSEKTWDCPCHDSKFLAEGEVLQGPAEQPLEKIAT